MSPVRFVNYLTSLYPFLNPSPQGRDEKDNWTPAFAGVTRVGGNDSVRWIPAFAGMTKRKGRN